MSATGSAESVEPDKAEEGPKQLSERDPKEEEQREQWKRKQDLRTRRKHKIRCDVICCNSVKVPGIRKLFFPFPFDEKLRLKWLRAIAGKMTHDRAKWYRRKRRMFVCEDHFNLENDLENYVRYRYGTALCTALIKLKKNAVPSKFPTCHPRPSMPEHCHFLYLKRPKTTGLSQLAPIVQFAKNLVADQDSGRSDQDGKVTSNVAAAAGSKATRSPSPEGRRMNPELNAAKEPGSRKVMDLLNGDISGLIARVQPSICRWDVSEVNVNLEGKRHDGLATSHESPRNSVDAQEGGESESAADGEKEEECATVSEGSRSEQIESKVEDNADGTVGDDGEPQTSKLDEERVVISRQRQLLRMLTREDDEWIPESDEASSLAASLPGSGSDSEEYVPKKKPRNRRTSSVRRSPRPSRQSARIAKRKLLDSDNSDSESSSTKAQASKKSLRGKVLRDARSESGDPPTFQAQQDKSPGGRPKRNCSKKSITSSKTDNSDSGENNGESDEEANKSVSSQPAGDLSREKKTETTTARTADKVASKGARANVGVNPKWRSNPNSSGDCTLGVDMDVSVATLKLENAPTEFSFKPVYEKVDVSFERAEKFFVVKEKSVDRPEDIESLVLPQNIVDLIDNMSLKIEKFFQQVDKLKSRVSELGPAVQKSVEYIDELRSGIKSFPALFELEMSEFAHKCKRHYGSLWEEQDEELKTGRWCSTCKKKAQFHCCFKAAYCSVSCQLIHWNKLHKFYCQQTSMTLIDRDLRLNPVVAARVKTLNSRKLTVDELESYYKSLSQAKERTTPKSPCRKATPISLQRRTYPPKKFVVNPRSPVKTKKSPSQTPKFGTTSPKASGSKPANSPKRPEKQLTTVVAARATSDEYTVEIKTEPCDSESQTKPKEVEQKNAHTTVEKTAPAAVVKDGSKFAFAFKSPQVKVAIPPHLLPKVIPKPVASFVPSTLASEVPSKPAILPKTSATTSTAGTRPLTTTIRCRAVVLPNGKKQYIPVDGQSWPFKTPQGVLTMEAGAQNSFFKSSTNAGSIFITRPAKNPGFIQLSQGSSRSVSIQNGKFTVHPPGVAPAPEPDPSPPPLRAAPRLPLLTPCKPVEKVRTLETSELDNILNTDHLKKVFDDSYFSKILPRP